MASADNFTNKIVSLVVIVVLVALVAIPLINGMIEPESNPDNVQYPIMRTDENATIITIMGILPVFLVLAVLLIIVRWFMGGREE